MTYELLNPDSTIFTSEAVTIDSTNLLISIYSTLVADAGFFTVTLLGTKITMGVLTAVSNSFVITIIDPCRSAVLTLPSIPITSFT
jgi:hypothetical protein